MYGSLFVCLLFYLNGTEAYLWLWKRYLVLDVLGHSWYVGTLVPINFKFYCVSVSLVVGTLSYWNLTKLEISPALGEISFWIFMDTFFGCFIFVQINTISNNCKYFCISWIQLVTFYHSVFLVGHLLRPLVLYIYASWCNCVIKKSEIWFHWYLYHWDLPE